MSSTSSEKWTTSTSTVPGTCTSTWYNITKPNDAVKPWAVRQDSNIDCWLGRCHFVVRRRWQYFFSWSACHHQSPNQHFFMLAHVEIVGPGHPSLPPSICSPIMSRVFCFRHTLVSNHFWSNWRAIPYLPRKSTMMRGFLLQCWSWARRGLMIKKRNADPWHIVNLCDRIMLWIQSMSAINAIDFVTNLHTN